MPTKSELGPDFTTPPVIPLPPGVSEEEVELYDQIRQQNADHSNETRNKLAMLLEYLVGFDEFVITTGNGERHMVLSKILGAGSAPVGANHPWKVSVAEDDEETGENRWAVTGGKIYTFGRTTGEFDVPDSTVTMLSSDTAQIIYLKVTYLDNPSNESEYPNPKIPPTLEIDDAVIEIDTELPTPDGRSRYYRIAIVDAGGLILQEMFEHLHIEFPLADTGDMIYHDGSRYRLIKRPPEGEPDGDGNYQTYVLGFRENAPLWLNTSVCEGNTSEGSP